MKSKVNGKAEQYDAMLEFKPMVGVGGGFRQEWVSGEGNGIKFSLDSGAGLGNPLMTLRVEKGGKSRYYTADIRPMLQKLLGEIAEAAEVG